MLLIKSYIQLCLNTFKFEKQILKSAITLLKLHKFMQSMQLDKNLKLA